MIIEHKPLEKLKPYIDVIWYVDEITNSDDEKNDTVIPSGHIHIVFNFADPYYLIENDIPIEVPNSIIVGQFKEAKGILYGNRVTQLGVAIRPSAFMMCFGKVSSLYTEAMVNADTISSLKELFIQLESVNEYTSRIKMIEDYFMSLTETIEPIEVLDSMIAYMEDNNGLIEVPKIAKDFGYSVSGLERLFKKQLGITPKAYANIIKFRQSMIIEDPATLFYDQSHFIKMCQKYTGKSPSHLQKTNEITLKHMLGIE